MLLSSSSPLFPPTPADRLDRGRIGKCLSRVRICLFLRNPQTREIHSRAPTKGEQCCVRFDGVRPWRSSRFCLPHVGEATTRAPSWRREPRLPARISALSEAPELPTGVATEREVTYTQQSHQGPTTVVEGYFDGDVEGGTRRLQARARSRRVHDPLRRARGERLRGVMERRGPVGTSRVRNECGDNDKMYIKVTNRPG